MSPGQQVCLKPAYAPNPTKIACGCMYPGTLFRVPIVDTLGVVSKVGAGLTLLSSEKFNFLQC